MGVHSLVISAVFFLFPWFIFPLFACSSSYFFIDFCGVRFFTTSDRDDIFTISKKRRELHLEFYLCLLPFFFFSTSLPMVLFFFLLILALRCVLL